MQWWKDFAELVKNFATALGIFVGGLWAYQRFIRQEQDYPHIEFSADIHFIAKRGEWWIVELIAVIENKGSVQHRVRDFRFDLAALFEEDDVEVSEQWGGQVNFPREISSGSFLPERIKFFFVDPGVTAKYSYVARVPASSKVLLLHAKFQYDDDRKYGHTAERSIAVPKNGEEANQSL